MGTTVYTGSTPGGTLLAEAMAELISARDKLLHVHGLVVQAAHLTGSFNAGSIEAGSGIFTVATGKGQEFHDKIGNLKTGLDDLWTDHSETIYSLSQG